MSDRENEKQATANDAAEAQVEERRAWQEPKLTFVEPELVKQGDMKQITTQGFFGTFVPD